MSLTALLTPACSYFMLPYFLPWYRHHFPFLKLVIIKPCTALIDFAYADDARASSAAEAGAGGSMAEAGAVKILFYVALYFPCSIIYLYLPIFSLPYFLPCWGAQPPQSPCLFRGLGFRVKGFRVQGFYPAGGR